MYVVIDVYACPHKPYPSISKGEIGSGECLDMYSELFCDRILLCLILIKLLNLAV